MPATKEDFVAFNELNLVGGAGPTSSGYQDLRTSYGGVWQIRITNNVLNRQAKGVQVQVEIAPDQTAGNTYPFDCRFIAGQDISEVSKIAIRIPPEAKFTRLTVTHGNEDAKITAILTRLSQV